MVFKSLLAGVAVIAVSASAEAALISSLENTGGPSGSSFSTTIGVTHGTYSLMVPSPGNWRNPTIYSGSNAGLLLKDNPILRMDITIPGEADLPGQWFQLAFGVQSPGFADGSGFKQSPWLRDGKPGVNGLQLTLDWDLSAQMQTFSTAGNPWFNVAIVHQGNANTDRIIYIDNIQAIAVPEPAALGAIAVSSLGLLRRRRRA